MIRWCSLLLFTLSWDLISSSILPDCECITGWTAEELDCTSATTDGTIDALEAYLTDASTDCYNSCHSNYECQQSLSLLTQYYDFCPLGSVSEAIIRSFWETSTCSDCSMTPFYSSGLPNNECTPSINCTSTTIIPEIQESVNYSLTYCTAINDSVSSSECTTECTESWLNISSFSRQCTESLGEFDAILDELYSDETSECVRDCNIVETNTVVDCNAEFNVNATAALAMYGKLDLDSLKQQTMLCFYGLNIDDPTNYQLVCVENDQLGEAGITSYIPATAGTNAAFFGGFGIGSDMDQLWVLICGVLVFFMQTGFSLLEAGAVKSSNVQNILFKNMMDACLGAVIFYMVGYCVAYGSTDSPDANGFIGVNDILIESEDYNSWFFQWAFAATAATIVSGAVAERCTLEAYFLYTMVISAWIYPVVVHWGWSSSGWISPFNENPVVFGGAIDFAGSAIVHMVGGFSGLMGAICLGPRFRRFDRSPSATASKHFKELLHNFEFGHNVPFQVLGTLILWFGWYGFNAGSTLAANGAMELASKVAVTTTLAAASGGLTTVLLAKAVQKTWHIPRICNGILAALVSITASCAVVSPGWAIVIGLIGGLVYYLASTLVEKLGVDDPLDAFAVHGCGGMWGVLSAGIFGTNETVAFAGYSDLLVYGTSHGERFGTQVIFVLSVAAWTIVNAGLLFGTLKWLGILRVSNKLERSGLDIFEHGGKAVDMRDVYQQVAPSTPSTTADEKGRTKAIRVTSISEVEPVDAAADDFKQSVDEVGKMGGIEEEELEPPKQKLSLDQKASTQL